MLGDLATAEGLTRLRLAPLSRRAVAETAEGRQVDGESLFRQTGGNPFFVTEALASGIPDTGPRCRAGSRISPRTGAP